MAYHRSITLTVSRDGDALVIQEKIQCTSGLTGVEKCISGKTLLIMPIIHTANDGGGLVSRIHGLDAITPERSVMDSGSRTFD